MVNNIYGDASGRYPFPEIGLRQVDQGVLDYFDKRLALSVDVGDGQSKKVPVLLASGERWKLIRDNKFRDENKTLVLPLITIQRMDVDRTLGFGGLGVETPNIVITKRIHPETNINQNLRTQRNKLWPTVRKNKVINEIITVPFPDFCTVYYQIVFWSQYQEQMNRMLEKVFYSYDYMDTFVIPMNYDKNSSKIIQGGFFVGFRETPSLSSQNNFEEFTDDERIIRYQYNVKVPAYFVLNPKDKPLSYGRESAGSPQDSGNHVVYKQQSADQISISVKQEKELTEEEATKLFNIII